MEGKRGRWRSRKQMLESLILWHGKKSATVVLKCQEPRFVEEYDLQCRLAWHMMMMSCCIAFMWIYYLSPIIYLLFLVQHLSVIIHYKSSQPFCVCAGMCICYSCRVLNQEILFNLLLKIKTLESCAFCAPYNLPFLVHHFFVKKRGYGVAPPVKFCDDFCSLRRRHQSFSQM